MKMKNRKFERKPTPSGKMKDAPLAEPTNTGDEPKLMLKEMLKGTF
jgi:hypothetical protein